MVMPCNGHNKPYACKKEKKVAGSSSAPSIKIRLSQLFATSLIFPLKYSHKSFALTVVTVVMSQQSHVETVLLAILSRYFLCSHSSRERACLWLWICTEDPGVWLRHRT